MDRPQDGRVVHAPSFIKSLCQSLDREANCVKVNLWDRHAISKMERPEYLPGTSEIGSLTAHSNEDSQFVGSSSGVYFINTVKRAFSTGLDGSGSPETEFPTAEETLVGADASPRHKRHCVAANPDSVPSPLAGESPLHWKYDPQVAAYLGDAPPLELSKELMMAYFKVWHPLFPFLHGPTFLQAIERLYSSTPESTSSETITSYHRSTCWTVICQCVFNLGALLRPDLEVASECRIQSPGSMTALLGNLPTRHDIASLQALLAAQVFLVAKMSLRPASTFGGCILRSMLHAGMHRCPFRYAQLSSHDRQLRKRIFWCAYAIDRYLSQALGLPLGIQDSDIDVCLPAAPEVHSPPRVRSSSPLLFTSKLADENEAADEGAISPTGHIGFADRRRSGSTAHQESQMEEYRKKESVLASYVDSGTLTGRALELFHKSILVRSVSRSAILFLVTDVHKWWNSLPVELQGKSVGADQASDTSPADSPFGFGPFFTILYQHLVLIINRPSLSLDPSTAEFSSGLQTCIGAARAILAALRLQVDSQQALFWPGFLSAAWMSGLVLAFACQLRQYVMGKGLQEIEECSDFLRRMSLQWETAIHCHNTLSLLYAKIKQMENDRDSVMSSHSYALRNVERANDSLGLSNLHEQARRRSESQSRSRSEQHYSTISESPKRSSHGHRGPAIGPVPVIPGHPANVNADAPPAELPISQVLEFQNMDTNYLAGGSTFDLNMGDLFGGSNFDSLLDMIGQQYPSF